MKTLTAYWRQLAFLVSQAVPRRAMSRHNMCRQARIKVTIAKPLVKNIPASIAMSTRRAMSNQLYPPQVSGLGFLRDVGASPLILALAWAKATIPRRAMQNYHGSMASVMPSFNPPAFSVVALPMVLRFMASNH